MCGATQEQKSLEASQAKFYDEMTANYKAVFGQQQAILDALTKQFQPILDKGPNQRGFNDAERTALETSSTENLAGNFADAKKELSDQLGARGGDEFLPEGSSAELESELAATGAAQRSSVQNQIEQADWALGRQNWQIATGALGGVAHELNPIGTSDSATGAGSAAGTTANQIAQASNSIWGSVIGGLSGIAGSAAGGFTTGMGIGAGAKAAKGG